MKRLNNMNFIHNNKINNISEWNVPHEIINYSKQTKNTNSHY